MKIGLIVAIEMSAINDYYGTIEKLSSPAGFSLYYVRKEGYEIYILQAGMGLVAAAAGTQYLITAMGVDLICNFGVVGGLTSEMKTQKVCVVDRVVHYRYDCSEFLPIQIGQVDGHDSIFLKTDSRLVDLAVEVLPELKKVTDCSGDRFVDKAEEKEAIAKTFSGDVCDMESAGIVLTCEANTVPCILFKAVSDGLTGGAGEFFEELKKAAYVCLQAADRVMSKIASK